MRSGSLGLAAGWGGTLTMTSWRLCAWLSQQTQGLVENTALSQRKTLSSLEQCNDQCMKHSRAHGVFSWASPRAVCDRPFPYSHQLSLAEPPQLGKLSKGMVCLCCYCERADSCHQQSGQESIQRRCMQLLKLGSCKMLSTTAILALLPVLS